MVKKRRYNTILAVFLLIKSNNKLLMVKRENSGWNDGNYCLPAGHVEKDESLTQALVREMKEELGIVPIRPKLVHMIHRMGNDKERLDAFFEVHEWKGKITNMEKNKCSDIRWFTKIPKNTPKHVRVALLGIKKGQFYSELEWG